MFEPDTLSDENSVSDMLFMISTYCCMFASMEAYNILSEARLNMTSSVCYFSTRHVATKK